MGTTTNGLTYPASTDPPNGSAQIQALAQGIDSAAYGGVWADYTPTLSWVSNTTITSAKWRRLAGKLVAVEFLLTTTGAPTSATLTLTLPVTAGVGTSNRISCGTVMLRDNSTGDASIRGGTVFLNSTTLATFSMDNGSDVTTSRIVTQAVPWTWAASDTIGGTFIYREA